MPGPCGQTGYPVFVRLREKHKLGAFLSSVERRGGAERLVPFGDLGELTKPKVLLDESNDVLARAVHEVFLRYPARDDATTKSWADCRSCTAAESGLRQSHPDCAASARLHHRRGIVLAILVLENEIETLPRWSIGAGASFCGRMAGRRGDTHSRDSRLHPLAGGVAGIAGNRQRSNRDMVRRIPEILEAAHLGIGRQGN